MPPTDLRSLGYRCPPDRMGPCGSPKDLLIWLIVGFVLAAAIVWISGKLKK